MTMSGIHSFAVLAYNESPYLEECILSLKAQTIKSRIVIFTSTPSEGIAEISRKYGIPVKVNKEKCGIASDWNFACSNCEGEYVTLAHQDDIYMPRYTEDCLSVIRKVDDKDNLIVFTWYNDLAGDKERIFSINLIIKKLLLLPFVIKPCIASSAIKKAILLFGSPIPCPSVMYHKSRLGNFSFSKIFECNMDWDAWLRLSEEKGSFIFANKKLFLHRISERSQTSLKIKNSVRYAEDFSIFSRLWPGFIARAMAALYSLSYRSNFLL